jgi:hypothetical protein
MYLIPNISVPVTGRFFDTGGNLWWNVQLPDFIPAEADRYWVLAVDVIPMGDCAFVPISDAPPSVIAPQPPWPVIPPAPTIGVPLVPTSVPTARPVSVSFYADRYTVNPRRQECATIIWVGWEKYIMRDAV